MNDSNVTYIVHGYRVNNPGTIDEHMPNECKVCVYGALQDIVNSTSQEVLIIFSGGKVALAEGQIESEATYMKRFFDEIKHKYPLDNKRVTCVEEGTSINSIENIDFALRLVPNDTDILKIVANDYHIPRLVATYYNRMEKGGIQIGSREPVYANKLLQSSQDEEIKQLLIDCSRDGIGVGLRQKLIETMGLYLARMKQEDLIQRLPANMPLYQVPVEIIKLFFSKKNE